MKPISFLLALTAALQVVAATDSFSAPAEASGEPTLWTRETLSGDWGGRRAALANRGVVLDVSTTGYYAGLLERDMATRVSNGAGAQML